MIVSKKTRAYPLIRQVDNKTFSVEEPIYVSLTSFGYPFLNNVIIKTGFKTDLASIPIGFRNIVSRYGSHTTAAVVHDYLYWTGAVDRRTADDIFDVLMEHYMVKRWKRWLMYHAVRIGGWKAYNKHRRNEDEST